MSDSTIDVREINILSLAHLGDGVYELLVRSHVISLYPKKPGDIHKETIRRVCANFQAEVYDDLSPLLTEKELSIMKRGRNNHTPKIPKNADCVAYRKATGVECLFGYLYAIDDTKRIHDLFTHICQKEGDLLAKAENAHR